MKAILIGPNQMSILVVNYVGRRKLSYVVHCLSFLSFSKYGLHL